MLTTLNLGTNNLKDVSGLHGLTQLKTLSLVDNDLEETTSIIGVIKTCLNLMELHISHNDVTKESIEAAISGFGRSPIKIS